MENVDICIRGNGIVGSTLALLLSRLNLRVALVGNFEATKPSDIRAYAINAKSKSIFESINAWPKDSSCTEVQQIRVSSDEGELIEFTHMLSGSGEGGSLSWIVEVNALEAELARALKISNVLCVPYGSPSRLEDTSEAPSEVHAALTVICEGFHARSAGRAKSTTRIHPNINAYPYLHTHTERTPYRQFALATHVTFKNRQQKHFGIAHQWFNTFENSSATQAHQASSNQKSGQEFEILALLPIGGREGNTFAVVWSTSEQRNQELARLSDTEFSEALRKSTKDLWSELEPALELVGARQSWPLTLASAASWCGRLNSKHSWVLCGDSAHSVHPLAGMGLNLGLGDVSALYDLLQAREKENLTWRPLNDLRLLRNYERQRKLAILPYVQFIDKIQLLFASDYSVAKLIRNQGFKVFNALGSLKEWTIKKAMQAHS